MRLHIALNGKDIEGLGLVALDGTLNALMKPAAFKKAVINENAAVDGTMVLSLPSTRKREKKSVTLPFFLRSTSLVDIQKELHNIEEELVNGMNGTGINELRVAELDQTYRLYYESMTSYTNFALDGRATIMLKFTEYVPTKENRL